MMMAAHVPLHKRYKLYREALSTATKLEGLTIVETGTAICTRYELWGDEIPKFLQHLRIWGECGVVQTKKVGTPKLENRGTVCMFVGYADSHAGDFYRMYDEDIQRVHITRDVRWLHRMYYDINGEKSR